MYKSIKGFSLLVLLLLLNACGGGGGSGGSEASPTQQADSSGANSSIQYINLSGTVTGLRSNLANSNGESLTNIGPTALRIGLSAQNSVGISQNGTFSLPTGVATGNAVSLGVVTQPTGQNCTVSNGSSSGSVSNIEITCTDTGYSVSGTVTGLPSGQYIVVSNNDLDLVEISANGQFYFPLMIGSGGQYRVQVAWEPSTFGCAVANGNGVLGSAPVTNITINCATSLYPISGQVTGLTGGQVTLYDNGADSLEMDFNGYFHFATPIAQNGSYSVTVAQQPPGQTCVVTNAAGTQVNSQISNVTVTCSAAPPATPTYNSSESPSISEISPSSTGFGCGQINIGINGSNFSPGAVVLWNGQPLSTSYISTTRLNAMVPAANIANAGNAGITVSNNTTAPNSNSMTFGFTGMLDNFDSTDNYTNAAHTQFTSISCPVAFPTAPLWTAQLAGLPQIVLIASDLLFATYTVDFDSYLIALNKNDGSIAWGPIDLKGQNPAMVYDNGKIFVAMAVYQSADGNVRAYNAINGELSWKVDLNQYTYSSVIVGSPPACTCGVSAGNGVVYLSAQPSIGGSMLYAINEQVGTYISGVPALPMVSGANGPPTVGPNGIYLSQYERTYAFDPGNLGLLWSRSPGAGWGGMLQAAPIVANNVLYSPDGFSSDGPSQTPYWGATYNAVTGVPIGSFHSDFMPAIGDQSAFLMVNGANEYGSWYSNPNETLQAVDLASGTVIWNFSGDGYLTSSPIATKHYTFVESRSGYVFAVDNVTGAQVWSAQAGPQWSITANQTGASDTGIVVGGGLLAVSAYKTLTVYALN